MRVPGAVGAALHLQHAGLIKSTGVDVDDVTVSGSSVGQRLVVLQQRQRSGSYQTEDLNLTQVQNLIHDNVII